MEGLETTTEVMVKEEVEDPCAITTESKAIYKDFAQNPGQYAGIVEVQNMIRENVRSC